MIYRTTMSLNVKRLLLLLISVTLSSWTTVYNVSGTSSSHFAFVKEQSSRWNDMTLDQIRSSKFELDRVLSSQRSDSIVSQILQKRFVCTFIEKVIALDVEVDESLCKECYDLITSLNNVHVEKYIWLYVLFSDHSSQREQSDDYFNYLIDYLAQDRPSSDNLIKLSNASLDTHHLLMKTNIRNVRSRLVELSQGVYERRKS